MNFTQANNLLMHLKVVFIAFLLRSIFACNSAFTYSYNLSDIR